jgi:hypothetical protein
MAIKFLNTVAVDTDVLYVDASSDRVGIGTTSPAKKLTIGGIGLGNTDGLKIEDPSNTAYGAHYSYDDGSTTVEIGGVVNNALRDCISIARDATRTITIDTSERVGIGTTSPSYKLDVAGDLRVDNGNVGSTSGDEVEHVKVQGARHFLKFKEVRTANDWDWKNTTFKLQTGVDSTNHQSIDFVTDGSYREHIDILTGNQVFNTRFTYDGKVGIGTTSPSEKLHVYNGKAYVTPIPYAASQSAYALKIGAYNSTSFDMGLQAKSSSGGSPYMSFRTTSADDVLVMRGGNVGIGTTSPDYLLDLYKSTATTSSSTGTTLQRLWNYVGSDLSQQKTFVDFVFQDNNNNEYPQVRIGAEVGQNGDADSQQKEGSGAFVVYTNNATGAGPGTPTGLAERFRVDYIGNVGIGETNPTSKLEVRSETATHQLVSLNRAASTTAAMYLGNDSGNNAVISSNNSDLIFGKDQSNTLSEWMRVTAAGNVGIGTTSPNHELVVQGTSNPNIELKNSNYSNGGFVLNRTNYGQQWKWWAQSSHMYFGYSTNESTYSNFLIVRNNGNVGVGVASPQAKLHVANGTLRTWTPTSGTSAIFESTVNNRNFVTLTAANEAELWFGNASTQTLGRIRYEMAGNNMEFWTNATQKMVINGSGNVGIGTTSPGAKLDIFNTGGNATSLSTAKTYSALTIKPYSSVDSKLTFSANSGSTQIIQATNNVSTTGRQIALQPFGGNVGIGTTSPVGKLDVKQAATNGNNSPFANPHVKLTATATADNQGFVGITTATSTADNYGYSFGAQRTSGGVGNFKINYHNNSSQGVNRFLIDQNGNVGIGAASPSEKLEVNGSVKATAATDAYKGYIKQNVISYGADKTESTDYKFTSYNTTATVPTAQAYNRIVAAYSGRVKKVYMRNAGGSTPTATAVNFKTHINGVTSTATYAATVANTASTNMTAYYEFADSDFTFNAGDLVGLLYQTTDGFGTASKTMGASAITITLEYNIT